MTYVVTTMQEHGPRQCGECNLCCKLLPMHTDYLRAEIVDMCAALVVRGLATAKDFAGMLPEFEKPAGVRCQHQRHQGCKVYGRRPFSCRMWNCRWLVNDDADDLRRPDRSHYVIDITPDFVTISDGNTAATNVEVVQVWCDPRHRDAWRDPALLAWLDRRGREGKAAIIRFSSREAVTVFPPSMAADGQWHEFAHGYVRPERTGAERIAGIASAQRVSVGAKTD